MLGTQPGDRGERVDDVRPAAGGNGAGVQQDAAMFNPFAPGFFDDPYSHYAVLREQDPVHRTPFDVWILFGYEECNTLLRDQSLSVEMDKALAVNPAMRTQRMSQLEGLFPEVGDARLNRSILFIDPPDHTRLRRLVSSVFTPRRIESLRAMVRSLVDLALDGVEGPGEMDVIADLAFPLPFTVISEMLGMPDSDRDQLRAWSHRAVKLLDPILSDDDARAAVESGMAMYGHCSEVIAWKRKNLADDLLSALITAEDEGDTLSAEELLDTVVLLFIAGHETTVNLIGNGTYRLLGNRSQLERLRDDDSLDRAAIEELLRFDSPVQFSRRITLEEREVGGKVIPAATFVMTCLGSANHDPAEFGPDAGELDLSRPSAGHHLSFGSGIHHCLGAALARLEGQEAIPRLIRRFPRLEAASEKADWNGRIVLRGLDSLPVSLGT